MGLQWPHLLLLLVIVLLVFGAGRISNIMGELGKGMKSFKQGMADEEEDKRRDYDKQRQLPRDQARPQEPIDVTPRPAEPAAPPPPEKDETR
jgi:sec-independent protein translocase protein TatA